MSKKFIRIQNVVLTNFITHPNQLNRISFESREKTESNSGARFLIFAFIKFLWQFFKNFTYCDFGSYVHFIVKIQNRTNCIKI